MCVQACYNKEVVREIQTAAPLKGVTLEIDKNQGKKKLGAWKK
jgi:hypothetical protein